jgi:hypothetical protein
MQTCHQHQPQPQLETAMTPLIFEANNDRCRPRCKAMKKMILNSLPPASALFTTGKMYEKIQPGRMGGKSGQGG